MKRSLIETSPTNWCRQFGGLYKTYDAKNLPTDSTDRLYGTKTYEILQSLSSSYIRQLPWFPRYLPEMHEER